MASFKRLISEIQCRSLWQLLLIYVGAERFMVEIKEDGESPASSHTALFDSGEADGFLFYVWGQIRDRDQPEREQAADCSA